MRGKVPNSSLQEGNEKLYNFDCKLNTDPVGLETTTSSSILSYKEEVGEVPPPIKTGWRVKCHWS